MNQNKLVNILKTQEIKNIFLSILLSVLVYMLYIFAFEYSPSSLSFKKHNEIKANYEAAKTFYDQGVYDKSLQNIYPIIFTKNDFYSLEAIKLLAIMYENGYGVEKNLIKSKKLHHELESTNIDTSLNLTYSNKLSFNYFNKIFLFVILCLIIIYSSKKLLYLLIVMPVILLIYNPLFEYNILHQEIIYFYFFRNQLFTFFTLFDLCIILFIVIDFKVSKHLILRLFTLVNNIHSLSRIKKYEKENKNIAIVFLNTINPLISSDSWVLKYLKEEEKKELWDNYLFFLIKNASKRGWNLNAKSDDGFNILSLALFMGYNQVVKFLVNLGIDVNEKITIKSHYEIFEKIEKENTSGLVFEENCDIYPIEIATRNFDAENIKLLLENGAQFIENNIYNVLAGTRQKNGLSTIEVIGAIGDVDLIKYLLDNGYKNNIDILLQKAVDYLKYDACKILLNYRDTSLPLVTSLASLIIDKNIELLKLFVDNGVILDEKECIKFNQIFENRKSYLILCIEGEDKEEDKITYYEIAKYLIEKGVDLNYKNPLINTLKHKWKSIDESYNRMDHKMFYLLADNGADIHYVDKTTGETILIAVCKSSYFMDKLKVQKINRSNNYHVRFFIENGAVTQDEKDIKVNMVKYLIEKGIDINLKDNQGNTALMTIENTQFEDINFIYDKNGYINFDENNFDENEYFFLGNKDVQIARLLIENGSDINIKNNLGYTPLMRYSSSGNKELVKYLLNQGVDTNIKIEVTASSLALNEDIKIMINDTKNNNPQKLIKILSNFTIDKPIKYTTHTWDFGELKKEYGDFDGYMSAVKKQFESMKTELEELSPNLYKKIYTFLIEENPDEKYSWYNKINLNIGWSSLEGLKEHCNSGNNPFDFKIPKPIFIGRKQLTTFGEVINLFKQEIEIRADFKNLEQLFLSQNIQLDLSVAKLNTRQFYTDTQKISSVLIKIFDEMKKREDFKNLEVITTELDDRSIEIKIIQIDSFANKNANDILEEVNNGDFADIKESLKNLCDWSIESSFEDENFRVNFLHSNNVKDIEPLETKPLGFTHILRFYK